MATEPAFIPEFGPNGAVMNAPTMTPELRLDYQREAVPKTGIIRGLLFPLVLLVMTGVQVIATPPTPLFGGMIAGFVVTWALSKWTKRGPQR